MSTNISWFMDELIRAVVKPRESAGGLFRSGDPRAAGLTTPRLHFWTRKDAILGFMALMLENVTSSGFCSSVRRVVARRL
jgi:hypothetical protein